VVYSLRVARYALLGILFALVIAAVGILVSIGIDANRTPTWFSAGIEHFRCGVSEWGWLPLPYCELKSAAKPDRVIPALMMVAAIIGVVLTLCLLVRFERKEAEAIQASLTSSQESPLSLSPPAPGMSIPHLSGADTAEHPKQRLSLTARLESQAGEG
jgi:hypothetical protein